jgi:hypothetical protein
MRAHRALAAVVLVSAGLLRAAPAFAESARVLGLDEMVGAADEIVVGQVERSETRWQGKLIVTVSTVRVDETLKGQPGSRIEVTELGGTAVHPVIGAPVTMTVSGQANLLEGENVLLFVEQKRPSLRQVVGAEQGKFVIRDNAASGAPGVPVGPKRLRVERRGESSTLAAEPMTLDTMRSRIRALVEGGKR